MALTDHVAILLGHSLDVPRLNKKKTRSDFYAQFALPPAAAAEVAALVSAVYPGVALSSIEVNFKTNAQQDKPFPGVPPDWFIIRMASQFAPELYDAAGQAMPTANARAAFFAGMRVRVHSSAWAWKNEFGKSGASFNLHAIMDAGQGGERLAIGGGAGFGQAFAAHANPNAVQQSAPGTNVQTVAQANTGNPFEGQQQANAGAAAQGANPFAQQAAAGNNPFAQSA